MASDGMWLDVHRGIGGVPVQHMGDCADEVGHVVDSWQWHKVGNRRTWCRWGTNA